MFSTIRCGLSSTGTLLPRSGRMGGHWRRRDGRARCIARVREVGQSSTHAKTRSRDIPIALWQTSSRPEFLLCVLRPAEIVDTLRKVAYNEMSSAGASALCGSHLAACRWSVPVSEIIAAVLQECPDAPSAAHDDIAEMLDLLAAQTFIRVI